MRRRDRWLRGRARAARCPLRPGRLRAGSTRSRRASAAAASVAPSPCPRCSPRRPRARRPPDYLSRQGRDGKAHPSASSAGAFGSGVVDSSGSSARSSRLAMLGARYKPNHTANPNTMNAPTTRRNAAPTTTTNGSRSLIAAKIRGMRLLEVRSYQLKPGTRDEYDRLFRESALPMLRRFEIDVVAAGPSVGDPNGYVLIRTFDDLADRQRRVDAFYASPEWRQGPREAVIERIVVYTDAVLELEEDVVEAL